MRAFNDGLVDNDEKKAFLINIPNSRREWLTPYPIYHQNGQTRDPVYDENGKRMKNHTFWGRTYLDSPYKECNTSQFAALTNIKKWVQSFSQISVFQFLG